MVRTPFMTNDSSSSIEKWNGLPYFPISQFYKNYFGGKTLKLPVSIPGTCPNREGLNGMKVCNFCDEWGSAAYPETRDQELFEQIENNKESVMRKGKVDRFLVYFQSYTFSYSRVARLRQYFEVCSQMDDVVGYVVGTRPDCISDAVLDLWNEYAAEKPVFVEFGVQTFNDDQLNWMSRGHGVKKSLWALNRLEKKCPELNVGIHLMFGLPGETHEQLIQTAQLINQLPVHNVKLHNLHVLKNTPLAEDYHNGKFIPVAFEEYCEKVKVFLQHLDPKIAVHRLAANSTRREELIAPLWTGDKMRTYQTMVDFLKSEGAYQGQFYKSDVLPMSGFTQLHCNV